MASLIFLPAPSNLLEVLAGTGFDKAHQMLDLRVVLKLVSLFVGEHACLFTSYQLPHTRTCFLAWLEL